MITRFTSLGLAVALAAPFGSSAQDAADSVVPPTDIRDVFATGYILEDRNGDEVVDFVNVRIVTQSIDRCARHGRRQASQQRRHASNIAIVFASLVGTTINDVIDCIRWQVFISFEKRA